VAAGGAGVGVIGAALVAVFGPGAPDYLLVLGAAVAGSSWPLWARPAASWAEAGKVVLRMASTSACLTGGAVWLVQDHLGVRAPTIPLAVAVAYVISASGNRWAPLMDAIWARVIGRIQPAAQRDRATGGTDEHR
jgi:hypothetical protein